MDALASLTRSKSVKNVSTGALTVGPELARHWLDTAYYHGQRPMNDGRIRLYTDEMQKGLWRLSELRFARTPDQHLYLMNGYTRLQSIALSGLELAFTVVVVDVKNMDEVAAEYATLDTQRVRMTKDLLRGYDLEGRLGFGLADQEKVARTAGIVASGFAKTNGARFSRTIQFRLNYLLEWGETATVLFEAMHTGHSLDTAAKRISNAPVFSVALVCTRFQPDKSKEFWNRVASNDGLRRGQPDWVMHDFLANMTTGTMREYPSMERKVASCWNAFYEGRGIEFLKSRSTDGDWAPIRIAGTPYDGRQTIQLYGGGSMIPGSEPDGMRPEQIWARTSQGEYPYKTTDGKELAAVR